MMCSMTPLRLLFALPGHMAQKISKFCVVMHVVKTTISWKFI